MMFINIKVLTLLAKGYLNYCYMEYYSGKN